MTVRRYFIVEQGSELMGKCVDAIVRVNLHLDQLHVIQKEIGADQVMRGGNSGKLLGFTFHDGVTPPHYMKKVRGGYWLPKLNIKAGKEIQERINQGKVSLSHNVEVGRAIGIGHMAPCAVTDEGMACSTVTAGYKEGGDKTLVIVTVPDRDPTKVTDKDLEDYKTDDSRVDTTLNWYLQVNDEVNIPGLIEVKKWEAEKLISEFNEA